MTEPVKPIVLPEVAAKMEEAAKKRIEETERKREEERTLKTVSDKLSSPSSKKEQVVTGKVVDTVKTPEMEEADKIEEECNKILAEYGGLEGNIPIHHGYWTMRNMARSARSKF